MSVVLSMSESGPCRLELKVEVPAAAVEAEMARVVGEYSRRVRVPGFRKGKVPQSLVAKQFHEEIEREVVERLVPRYWKQAAAEKELQPLAAPEVSGIEVVHGEPLRFTATVETRPKFELGDVTHFDLPEPPVEPAPEEVDAALENLRREHADWLPADRPAAHGDRAKVAIVELADDGTVAPQTQELEVELGGPRVWEELSLALVGAEPNQEREFERTEGEGENQRRRRFRAAVAEVKRAELPPLDDSLAAKLGRFADLDAVKSAVTAGLRAARARERRRQREQAALEQLMARHSFPLPEGVVKHEIEHLLRDYAEGLASRGVDIEKSQIDWQGLGEQLRPQAERRVRARILLDAVAEAQGIEVAAEELERAVGELARAQGRTPLALRQSLDERGQLGELRRQLTRDKTVSALLGELPQPAAATSGAEP